MHGKCVQAIALEERISLLTDLQLFKFRRFPERRRQKNSFFFLRAMEHQHPDWKPRNSGIQRLRRAGSRSYV